MIEKQSNKLRVCLISPVPPPYGGISNWTLLLHKYLSAKDDVEIFQLDTSPRWREIYDLSIPKRIIGGGFQLIRDLIRLITILIKNDTDIIHLTTSGSLQLVQNWVFCCVAHIFKIPVVYHIHFGRIPEMAKYNTLEWKVFVKVVRLTSVVIGITSDTCNTIKRCIPEIKTLYIPNPIDLDTLPKPRNNDLNDKLILFLGHVIPTKGIRELVQAWAEVSPQGWKLIIAGPGKQEYKQRLLDEYKPSNLSFIGELNHDDALQLMSRCSLVILPSHTEGFPNVILEAMALRKAIIATKVGAIPEMLSNQCGLLIEPKNVEGLKNSLIYLCQNSDIRETLANNAYEKVKMEYNADLVFSQYIELWQNLSKHSM